MPSDSTRANLQGPYPARGTRDITYARTMNAETLNEQRTRTHAIVEGALLGDIAIVFLMMRVYLPLPVVRTLLRTLGTVPLVMLTQRRGLKITILAAIASYILFSALVGPILALSAIDIAVSGMLVGLGRKWGIGPALNTLWTGVVYTILDLLLPTIASLIIFRYPIKKLVESARHFVRLIFQFLSWILHGAHASAATIHEVHTWQSSAVAHWFLVWLGILLLYGLLNQYLAVLVTHIVLNQLPNEILQERKAA